MFNDRASSLLVVRGYWIFCSDANFGGGAGRSAQANTRSSRRELDNRISSGRRISNAYPYTDSPTGASHFARFSKGRGGRPRQRMLVQRQYDGVLRNHDQIRDLRDRYRATQT